MSIDEASDVINTAVDCSPCAFIRAVCCYFLKAVCPSTRTLSFGFFASDRRRHLFLFLLLLLPRLLHLLILRNIRLLRHLHKFSYLRISCLCDVAGNHFCLLRLLVDSYQLLAPVKLQPDSHVVLNTSSHIDLTLILVGGSPLKISSIWECLKIAISSRGTTL